MMETKHTPGPWKIRDEEADWVESGACFDIDTVDGKHIGFVTRSTIGISGEESLTNARLIAAAPDYDQAARIAEVAIGKLLNIYAGDQYINSKVYDHLVAAWNALNKVIDKVEGE